MWIIMWIIINGRLCRVSTFFNRANQVWHFIVQITNFRSILKPWMHCKFVFPEVQEISQQQKSEQIMILHLYIQWYCLVIHIPLCIMSINTEDIVAFVLNGPIGIKTRLIITIPSFMNHSICFRFQTRWTTTMPHRHLQYKPLHNTLPQHTGGEIYNGWPQNHNWAIYLFRSYDTVAIISVIWSHSTMSCLAFIP